MSLPHRALAAAVLALATLAGCARRPPPSSGPVHYVVGAPYQALGVWRYPREQFGLEETGLAAVLGNHPPVTTDNEAFDPRAMAAAHPTLQLPALVEVTNLENGRAVNVRVNDRGPVPANRLIGLTPRAAELIGANDGSQLRIRVLDIESRQLAAEMQGDAGKLAIATSPKAAVSAESLAPPPGVGQGRARIASTAPAIRQAAAPAAASAIPLRLPEQVSQTASHPGSLYIQASSFGRLEYADIQRRRLAGLGARVVTSYASPRDRAYRVEIGPIDGVTQADALLGQVLAAGVSDARIVVQ